MTNIAFETALEALIEEQLLNYRCFTAGELATILRHRDPSLYFSVANIAERLNAQFEEGDLVYEDDQGFLSTAVRVRRLTVGTGRIRAGIPVWVYGPTFEEADEHPFEVDIALPGDHRHPVTQSSVIDVTPIPTPTPAASFTNEALIRSALNAHNDETTLQAARRMRLSMESLKASAMAQITLLQTL